MEAIGSDGWRSYGRAEKNRDLSHCRVVLRKPVDAGRLLSWVHGLISNAKAVIRGTHRGVSEKHLQAYPAILGEPFFTTRAVIGQRPRTSKYIAFRWKQRHACSPPINPLHSFAREANQETTKK